MNEEKIESTKKPKEFEFANSMVKFVADGILPVAASLIALLYSKSVPFCDPKEQDKYSKDAFYCIVDDSNAKQILLFFVGSFLFSLAIKILQLWNEGESDYSGTKFNYKKWNLSNAIILFLCTVSSFLLLAGILGYPYLKYNSHQPSFNYIRYSLATALIGIFIYAICSSTIDFFNKGSFFRQVSKIMVIVFSIAMFVLIGYLSFH